MTELELRGGIWQPVETVDPATPLQWQGPVPLTRACRCGALLVRHTGTTTTCLGWFAVEGHCHDPNQPWRDYSCEAGHATSVSRLQTCPACDWHGRLRETTVHEWPR